MSQLQETWITLEEQYGGILCFIIIVIIITILICMSESWLPFTTIVWILQCLFPVKLCWTLLTTNLRPSTGMRNFHFGVNYPFNTQYVVCTNGSLLAGHVTF